METILPTQLLVYALLGVSFLILSLSIYILLYVRSTFKKPSVSGNTDTSDQQKLLQEVHESIAIHKQLLDRLLMSSEGLEAVDQVNSRTQQALNELAKKSDTAVADIVRKQEEQSAALAEIMTKAQAQAQHIVQDAMGKAEMIVANTDALQKEVSTRMVAVAQGSVTQSDQIIKQAIDNMLAGYKEALIAKQEEHINLLQTININIEEQVKQRTEDIFVAMRKEILDASNQKRELVEKEMQQIQTDLDTYKKQQLTKIEVNIYEILARASESVIGQAVNFDVHQELIIKALEQAKREGVFI